MRLYIHGSILLVYLEEKAHDRLLLESFNDLSLVLFHRDILLTLCAIIYQSMARKHSSKSLSIR